MTVLESLEIQIKKIFKQDKINEKDIILANKLIEDYKKLSKKLYKL